MNICRNEIPSELCCGKKTTATLGTFDGVHLGHRQILESVKNSAEISGEKSAVVTFDSHPKSVLKPESMPGLLTTLDEKNRLFDSAGIDIVFVITFTPQISEMSAENFLKKYLIDCLNMSHFVIGYDHGFGKNRSGTMETLRGLAKEFNFTLEIQSPVTINGITIKSSAIRKYIVEGKTDVASELLGADYSIRGKVVPGYGKGKKIGIPTANISILDSEKIIPQSGVYAGWISFKDIGKKEAVINIGSRPTFNRNDEAIEVHIPGFEGDLYGEDVMIGFSRRLRSIKKFESEKELINQIKKDIEKLNHLILI